MHHTCCFCENISTSAWSHTSAFSSFFQHSTQHVKIISTTANYSVPLTIYEVINHYFIELRKKVHKEARADGRGVTGQPAEATLCAPCTPASPFCGSSYISGFYHVRHIEIISINYICYIVSKDDSTIYWQLTRRSCSAGRWRAG